MADQPVNPNPPAPQVPNTAPGAPVSVPASPTTTQAPPASPTRPAAAPNPLIPAPDPGANPVLVETPGVRAPLHTPDKNSNPAAMRTRMGGEQAPNPSPGTAQTTINTATTTIHPDASITNPVLPSGKPAPLKKAVVGQQTPQVSNAAQSAAAAEAKK